MYRNRLGDGSLKRKLLKTSGNPKGLVNTSRPLLVFHWFCNIHNKTVFEDESDIILQEDF